MESMSSVRTIMGIVQDILSAVETASRNKSRCDKLAKRVRCLKDMVAALDEAPAPAPDGTTTTTTTDAATRNLLDRLEEALSRALVVVRRCQRFSFLRSVIVAGGRMADPLDAVETEIDRCILDLTFAYSLRIPRLETLLVRQHNNSVAVAAASTEDDGEKQDENKRKEEGSAEGVVADKNADDDLQVPIGVGGGAEMEHDNATATAPAIGVPVCTVAAAVHDEHKHDEVVVPPPIYGWNGYGYRSYGGYWRNHGYASDSWDGSDAGGPSDAAFFHTQYSSCPSMFSDDDPNSCSIL